MKKFTLMLMATLMVVFAQAVNPAKRMLSAQLLPQKQTAPVAMNAKQAPAGLMKQAVAKARAAKKVATSSAELEGTYLWEYQTTSEQTNVDPSAVSATDGSAYVTITAGDNNTLTVTGMFGLPIVGTYYPEDGYILFPSQAAYESANYGVCNIQPVFYYEGDDQYQAGWYYNSYIYAYPTESGTIVLDEGEWLQYVIQEGDYAGYYLNPQWLPGSTLTPAEGPQLVEVPAGVEAEEFLMSYTETATSTDLVYVPVKVAVDGNDVYVQGISYYLSAAWVKGTKSGNTVTFPTMQFVGNYGSYGGSYAFYNGDAVFTYDAEAGTYTAEGEIYGVLGERYYDGHYFNLVLTKVAEQAAMPANPSVVGLNNTDWGYVIDFNVPAIDVDGNGLLASKLYYQLFTETAHEAEPLTFTPATHVYLEEAMSVIPYGFTEDYDFYTSRIYLNELYSANWNRIGIKSIYTGGGETNETEIQWLTVKEYNDDPTGDFTINFNTMNVPTSSGSGNNYVDDGDINEDLTIEEGTVTLTVSPKSEESPTPNRFWYQNNVGTQLRCYSGTLTFDVPEGFAMTQIVFNYQGKYWGGNNNAGNVTASTGTIADNADTSTATWTGEAQQVVFAIGANTQLNSIVVTVVSTGSEEPVEDVLVVVPDGVALEDYSLTGIYQYDESSTRAMAQTVQVAFDGDDVYVQGLAYWFPEAFVKGTIANGVATFKNGQFVGEDEYGKEYILGYDNENGAIVDYQFAFDAETRTLTQLTDFIVENGDYTDQLYWYGIWSDVVFAPGEYVEPEAITLPEGAESQLYTFKGFDTYYEEDVTGEVQVAFVGDEVYIQGLSRSYLPEGWVKGTLTDGVLTIPACYMGTFSFWGYEYKLNFNGAVFTYDAEADQFTAEEGYTTVSDGQVLDEFIDVVLNRATVVAATPAMPEIVNFDDTGYGYFIECEIPLKDVDGNDIYASNLSYQVLYDIEGETGVFEFTTDDYIFFEENLTEIPYSFTDSYDVGEGGWQVYLNSPSVEDWTKVGLKSIYRAAGETRESDVFWYDLAEYWDVMTGIATVATDGTGARYFDLQGRVAPKAGKGLLIKQVRQADGSMKTVKVVK